MTAILMGSAAWTGPEGIHVYAKADVRIAVANFFMRILFGCGLQPCGFFTDILI
jgi:hypothetical protein